jgi:RES domain-containing protein
MHCCPDCFAHAWLKEHVREISKENGQCDFCGSEDVPLVRVCELAALFHNLLSMYVPADSYESGEPLFQLIQCHWQVFSEDVLDEDAQAKLLEEIANSDWDDDDGEPVLAAKELYSPLGDQFHTTHRERWEEFCLEVRDNPNEPLPFDDFYAEEFALLEVNFPIASMLYRARRGFEPGEYGERVPFLGNDLAAPPVEKALAGRANTERQRVLYCADQEKTAIAEVRPPLGYYVSVGTLKLEREARILDLTKEVNDINPFVTESVSWHVEIRSLLNAFGEEMSRPLERDDDKTHYLPCQKLAAFIRDTGYDGIRYPSAISPGGSNVVLFDPDIAGVADSRLARVTELTFEYEVDEAAMRVSLADKTTQAKSAGAEETGLS